MTMVADNAPVHSYRGFHFLPSRSSYTVLFGGSAESQGFRSLWQSSTGIHSRCIGPSDPTICQRLARGLRPSPLPDRLTSSPTCHHTRIRQRCLQSASSLVCDATLSMRNMRAELDTVDLSPPYSEANAC